MHYAPRAAAHRPLALFTCFAAERTHEAVVFRFGDKASVHVCVRARRPD